LGRFENGLSADHPGGSRRYLIAPGPAAQSSPRLRRGRANQSQCLATRHSRTREARAAAQASVKISFVASEFLSERGTPSLRSDLLRWCWLRLVSSICLKESPLGAALHPPRQRERSGGLDGHNHSPERPPQPLGGLFVSSHGCSTRTEHGFLPPPCLHGQPPQFHLSFR